jgi:superfamily I DNA/RNA helicase
MPTKQAQHLKEIILAQQPTKEQEAAIFAEEQEFLLRASPGSGKTWTSCRRFLWRAENWESKDGGLALLSFTNTAIKEFQAATISAGRRGALSDPHFVGTFDSFVERFIITPFGHLACGTKKRPRLFLAARPGDRKNKKLLVWAKTKDGKTLPIPAWEITPYVEGGKVCFKSSMGSGVFQLDGKQSLTALSAFMALGFYTHNQRNFWASHLLRKFPRITTTIARRFPEIIVDEAQDTGFWLINVLKHLRASGARITLIGDPDQCIYEFSLASASSLADLKATWQLVEKPLNKSFRCNNAIAAAVRQISGNMNFEGCGEPQNEFEKAFVIGDSSVGFQRALAFFREQAKAAGVSESDSAILCRGHEQVAKIRGTVRYLELTGKTKQMAEAAFLRDKKGAFKKAFEITESVLRELVDGEDFWSVVDEQPDSAEAQRVRLAIWGFVRSPESLPSIAMNGKAWMERLKTTMGSLLTILGVKDQPSLGTHFQRRGLDDGQMQLPLFDDHDLFPKIRFDTIHKAKGESIGGVLVVGSKRFYDTLAKEVTSGVESEDKRLGYVAMTRARHLLVIATPSEHLKAYAGFWNDRGFIPAD